MKEERGQHTCSVSKVSSRNQASVCWAPRCSFKEESSTCIQVPPGLGYEVATSIMPLIQRRPRRNTDTFEIPEHAPFMSHGRLLPGQPSAKSSFKCEEQTSTVHQCATKFEFPRAVYVRPPVPSACSCEGTSPLNCWIPSSRVQHLQRIGKRLWPWKGRC